MREHEHHASTVLGALISTHDFRNALHTLADQVLVDQVLVVHGSTVRVIKGQFDRHRRLPPLAARPCDEGAAVDDANSNLPDRLEQRDAHMNRVGDGMSESAPWWRSKRGCSSYLASPEDLMAGAVVDPVSQPEMQLIVLELCTGIDLEFKG